MGSNTIYFPESAAYRALILQYHRSPDFLKSLPDEIWQKWAPIILAYPTINSDDCRGIHNEMVKLVYRHAPGKIIETLLFLIDKENQGQCINYGICKIEKCWDENLVNILEAKIKDENLKPDSMRRLVEDLLKHRSHGAIKYAESLLSLSIPFDGDGRKKVAIAAEMLMLFTHDAGWPTVWPVLQKVPDFGREVILSVAQTAERKVNKIEEQLSDDQLTDLYIWMEKQFPYSEDPEIEGGIITPRFDVARWRASILNSLKTRGTYQACEGIRRIMEEFPDLDWLERHLYDARNLTRQQTWQPHSIKTILEITKNRNQRLVQNELQLIEVLVESFQRLESKLHDEIPASRDLWDYNNKKWKPVKEDDFSNYVKRHLDDDLNKSGIIVNREVQIHKGERTDLHVDAISKDDDEEIFKKLTVIIEVKGCWHNKLNTAMKEQLVDRYLIDNKCKYGIYLVGWFNCPLWDKKDYRYRQAPIMNIAEAREKFNNQADKLSREGYNIKAVVLDTSY